MPTWGWPVRPQLSPPGVLWPRKSHWKQKSSPVLATLAFLGQLLPQGPTCKVDPGPRHPEGAVLGSSSPGKLCQPADHPAGVGIVSIRPKADLSNYL